MKLTPTPTSKAQYASAQDVPVSLRHILRTLHHERGRSVQDIARIFELPSEWVELFVRDDIPTC